MSPSDASGPSPSPWSQPHSSKPQRVLACVRCQQRKVKCDRRFPCSHCTTSRTQCVPSTLTPRTRRKRRFPERELLERLRKYEDILRQNNIKFDPLHKDSAGDRDSPNTQDGDESDEEQPETKVAHPPSSVATAESEKVFEAKSVLSKNQFQLG
jgi:Fungal Zn(2)-Cys(6) binuclear cluster domain